MTARTDLPRPRFARMYQRSSKTAERRGATEHRRRLLHGLSGTVLELGAGHGLNFPCYPSEVTEVIGVEPEPTLRARATQAAAPVPIRVLAMVASPRPAGQRPCFAAPVTVAEVLTHSLIRGGLRAHQAVARVAEQPPASTPRGAAEMDESEERDPVAALYCSAIKAGTSEPSG